MRPDRDKTTLWLKLANAPEGEREHALGIMLRKHGLPWVVAHVGAQECDVRRWAEACEVPARWAASVRDAYRSYLAVECRAGRGKIDVDEAERMAGDGVSQEAIGAQFGATQQGVSRALARRARKRDALNPARRMPETVTAEDKGESDAA
jgi:hypothetical protein